jgi:hypothetical protein
VAKASVETAASVEEPRIMASVEEPPIMPSVVECPTGISAVLRRVVAFEERRPTADSAAVLRVEASVVERPVAGSTVAEGFTEVDLTAVAAAAGK